MGKKKEDNMNVEIKYAGSAPFRPFVLTIDVVNEAQLLFLYGLFNNENERLLTAARSCLPLRYQSDFDKAVESGDLDPGYNIYRELERVLSKHIGNGV